LIQIEEWVMALGLIALVVVLLAASTIVVVMAQRDRAQIVSSSNQWRAVLGIRVLFLILGIVVAGGLIESGLARNMMIAPTAVGYFLVLGVFLGEAVVKAPRPSGVRAAGMKARSLRSYIDRASLRSLLALLAIHVTVLVFTTAIAIPDDMGRPGRAIGYSNDVGGSWSTPFPGLIVFTGLAAFWVVRRPRGYSRDFESEEAMRTSSVATVLGALGVSVAVAHIGLAGVAAMHLISQSTTKNLTTDAVLSAPSWFLPAGIVVLMTVVLALVIGVRLAAATVFPRNVGARA
jgi:hypothetical protein